MYRTNYVEIKPAAIEHNARVLRGVLSPHAGMMAVVKADGYGHGAVVAATAALAGGASMLAVAIPEEGEALRAAGIHAPILVLGNVEPASALPVAQLGLGQTVCDAQGVAALCRAACAANVRVPVHIKLDTGMGRLGVRTPHAALALAESILNAKALHLAGVFTHFACADMPERDNYTHMQRVRFEDMLSALSKLGAHSVLRHAANSAAMLRFPWAHYDMARVGISLYGAQPEGANAPLRSAMRWVTRVSLVKEIASGEGVGYGATFIAQRPARIAVLPVGYADGYRCALGNRASVLIGGHRAPIVGRVCMDQCMVDVTGIPSCAVGDEVVLLGQQGAHSITVQEMAQWMDTIVYEVMLSPSARVPRVVLEE